MGAYCPATSEYGIGRRRLTLPALTMTTASWPAHHLDGRQDDVRLLDQPSARSARGDPPAGLTPATWPQGRPTALNTTNRMAAPRCSTAGTPSPRPAGRCSRPPRRTRTDADHVTTSARASSAPPAAAETSATGMNTQMKYTPGIITELFSAMSQKKQQVVQAGFRRPASTA